MNKKMELLEKTIKPLTKREYFAALAFQTLLRDTAWIEFERGVLTQKTLQVADQNSKVIADICVKYADALLAGLEENR